jgi:hypothetical protein
MKLREVAHSVIRGVDSWNEESLGPNRNSASLNILDSSCINACSWERSPAVNKNFVSASIANSSSMMLNFRMDLTISKLNSTG